MRPQPLRLRLEGFEDRLTPAVASPTAMKAMASAAFVRASLSGDPTWMTNPQLQSFVQSKLREAYNASLAASTAFRGVPAGSAQPTVAGFPAVARANMAVVRQIGIRLGLNVVPVVTPTPPAPTTPANDAGMTNTMPDPNAPNWVAVGAAGLKTWDVVQGTGTPVAAGDSINVFYSGWLASNGTRFDSRRSPSTPVKFDLDGLIQGWQQAIPGMRNGGIRRIFVPSALGYGAAGSPPNIPANADLVFEIKVISHS